MKILRNISLLGATVALSSCGIIENMNQPLSDDGFNPLDKAGSYKKNADGLVSVGSSSNPSMGSGHGFKSGDIVDVAIANTALFSRVPQPGDKYKKVLKVGDALKVIGTEKDFLKVTTPSGETGYVSSVMVISQGAFAGGPVAPMGDIAPPPEIPGIEVPTISPVEPIPVPSITDPVEVDPVEVPSLPDPAPVLPDPAPAVPNIEPVIPSIPDEPAPDPEIPGLPE